MVMSNSSHPSELLFIRRISMDHVNIPAVIVLAHETDVEAEL